MSSLGLKKETFAPLAMVIVADAVTVEPAIELTTLPVSTPLTKIRSPTLATGAESVSEIVAESTTAEEVVVACLGA